MVASRSGADQRGFTLIELITAVGVLSILMTLAVPSFRMLSLNAKRAAAVNEMVVGFQNARSVAIHRHKQVVVCRTSTPAADMPVCGNGTGWETGWITFVDTDGDFDFDNGEEVLKRHEALATGITARGQGGLGSRVSFTGTGISGAQGKIAYCDGRGWGDDVRILQLSLGGRLQTLNRGEDPAPVLTACS